MIAAIVTVTQAAEALGLSRSRVRLLVATGRIRAEAVGSVWLIRVRDLDAFAKVPRPVGTQLSGVRRRHRK